MDPVKFNSTANYQYMTVLGKEGVFTPEYIDPKTLPAGFYTYSLVPGEDTAFKAICETAGENHAGSLVTKGPLPLRKNIGLFKKKATSLDEDDWSFSDKDFDFESYFGCKLSIDAQICIAEAKRDQQVEASRGKNRSKSKSRSETERNISDY